MKLFYLPYKMSSESVDELKKSIGGLRILPNGNYAFDGFHHLVVNWGHGSVPYWGTHLHQHSHLLNHWTKVRNSINKITSFELFKAAGNVPTVEWSTRLEDARKWIKAGHIVLCRGQIEGKDGSGVVIAKGEKELISCRLYTKLFPIDIEYRVHIFKGKVIDFVQKKRSYSAKPRDPYLRTTANGWIFARQGVELPKTVGDASKKAVAALGLDFGAVDLAIDRKGTVAVFEVNTAPELEGPTIISRYSEAIKKYQESLA